MKIVSKKPSKSKPVKPGKKWRPGMPIKYKPELLITIYELAKDGMPDGTIARTLGILPMSFTAWVRDKPEVRQALKRGREFTPGVKTFTDFVYGKLPRNLKKKWDEIMAATRGKKKDECHRLVILSKTGKVAKQKLWFHAWIHFSFNISKACEFINIPISTYNHWVANDPRFAELIQELDFHKGNFFEGCLINLCKRGDTAAIIHANKTFNKNRGYGDKLSIDHTGNINHTVQLDNDRILSQLSIEARKEILKVIREEREKLVAGPASKTPALEDKSGDDKIMEAEFTVHEKEPVT